MSESEAESQSEQESEVETPQSTPTPQGKSYEFDEEFQVKIIDLGNACWTYKHFTSDIQVSFTQFSFATSSNVFLSP